MLVSKSDKIVPKAKKVIEARVNTLEKLGFKLNKSGVWRKDGKAITNAAVECASTVGFNRFLKKIK